MEKKIMENKSSTLDFITLGAVPDDSSLATEWHNAKILNETLQNHLRTMPNSILHIQGIFHIMGGITGGNLTNVTILLDGAIIFSPHIGHWPRKTNEAGTRRHVLECMQFSYVDNVTFTSSSMGGGKLYGNGDEWWGYPGIGYLVHAEDRPRLLSVTNGTNVVLENWVFVDSPYWTARFYWMDNLVIRYSAILNRRTRKEGHSLVDLTAFNTDGFDVKGEYIHIHDCNIWCQDDAVAVKEGSEHVLVERVNATGMGLVIGSIGKGSYVRNVTFRDCYLYKPYKGIFFKFRQSEEGMSYIENILVENVIIEEPVQWPIWIGPAQQSDTRNPCLANPCSLCWPAIPLMSCQGQKNGTFHDIVLRNITINRPKLSAGVILSDRSNPMTRVVFDGVRVVADYCGRSDESQSMEDIFPMLTTMLGSTVTSHFVIWFRVTVLLGIAGLLFVTVVYCSLETTLLILAVIIPMMLWMTYQTVEMQRVDSYFKCEGVNGVALGDTWPIPDCFEDHTNHERNMVTDQCSRHHLFEPVLFLFEFFLVSCTIVLLVYYYRRRRNLDREGLSAVKQSSIEFKALVDIDSDQLSDNRDTVVATTNDTHEENSERMPLKYTLGHEKKP